MVLYIGQSLLTNLIIKLHVLTKVSEIIANLRLESKEIFQQLLIALTNVYHISTSISNHL